MTFAITVALLSQIAGIVAEVAGAEARPAPTFMTTIVELGPNAFRYLVTVNTR